MSLIDYTWVKTAPPKPNAFTIPAKSIQIGGPSTKQIRDSATRVNRNTHMPTSQADKDRSAALIGRGTCNWKDQ